MIQQGTEEWLAQRRGKLTASNFSKLMGIKALGETGLTYIKEVVAEQYMWYFEQGYVSEAMQRGKDLEPIARERYELETMNTVQEVGFIELNEYIGGSPDGLVGEDGGIEIKCYGSKKHLEILVSNEIPKEAVDQMQGLMYITNRKWWDFVSFNPDFVEGKQLMIIRLERDEVWVEKFEGRLQESIEIINNYKSILNG